MPVLVLALLAVAGCGAGRSDEQILERSAAELDAGRPRVATVTLTDLLARRPPNVAAHLLHADALLALGDTSGAASALQLASAGGADPADRRMREVEILLAEGKLESAAQLALEECGTARECVAYGRAALAAGDVARAARLFNRGKVLDVDLADVDVGLAAVAERTQGSATARSLLLRAMRERVADAELWLALGEIEARQGRWAEARVAFRRAAERSEGIRSLARRGALFVHLAEAELANRDIPAAREAVKRLTAEYGESLVALWLRARVAIAGNDIQEAERAALRLLERQPDSAQALLLLGSIKADAGQIEQAAMYLQRATNIAPDDVVGRKLLARVLAKQGRVDDALRALEPALAASPGDGELLALFAELQGGGESARPGLLARLDAAPDDPAVRLAVATGLLASGDPLRARQVLERPGVEWGAEGARAAALLALSSGAAGDPVRLRAALASLLAAKPDEPATYAVAAGIAARAGLPALGVEVLRPAVKRFPKDATLQLQLGLLEADAGNAVAARQWISAAARDKSRGLEAGLALTQLDMMLGNGEAATASADSLAARYPASLAAARQQVMVRMWRGDLPGAESRVQGMLARFGGDAAANALAAEVAMAAGNASQAVGRYRQALARGAPVENWVSGLAAALNAAGDATGATKVLNDALARDPASVTLSVALANHHLKSGRIDAALEVSRALGERYPSQAVGPGLGADIWRQAGNPQKALPLAEEAWRRGGKAREALRLLDLRKRLRAANPTAPLEEHLSREPGDLLVARTLATELVSLGRNEEALVLWSKVAERMPGDAMAWNNVAWLRHDAGLPGSLADAERAFRLAPQNPMVLDTLGWILVGEGRAAEAVTHLRNAAKGMPNDRSVAYHLAVALARSGRRDEARAMAARLAEGGQFKEMADVDRLLAELD